MWFDQRRAEVALTALVALALPTVQVQVAVAQVLAVALGQAAAVLEQLGEAVVQVWAAVVVTC